VKVLTACSVARARRVFERLHLAPTARIDLFGVHIDITRMDDAVAQVLGWINDPSESCRYVVTPNVDHTVMLQHDVGLRTAYKDANLVLADGFPVVLASRLLGKALPERVTGSDLVPALFDAADPARPLRTFLLGAAPGVAEIAADRIHAQWPDVRVVDVYSPPKGFEHDDVEIARILNRVRSARPDVLVVGFGAPKQELWVHRHRNELEASVALCVGATIDFLAGAQSRAPQWMQRAGLEWLFRLLTEPRRLLRRYARDAWIFPQLVWREWRKFTGRRDEPPKPRLRAG
jgi:N-acetylglucosaminyldiphosphoundecaprenol N-acetyl-beta-D-mannosaminyltransferase